MTAVGRNEPCPCGSGKKYKKCCLLREEAPSGAYTDAEQESARLALGRFGWRHEFDGERAVAEARFRMSSMLALVPERDRWEVDRQAEMFFQDWFTTDVRIDSGRTLLELFVEREGRRLRSGERRYLERLRLTHLRPYEVVGVTLDEGLELVDLWTRKRLHVRERLATRQIAQWNVLAARLMLGPAGVLVIDGPPYLYPEPMKDSIVKDLRRLHRKFRRQVPGDDVDFFKRFGSVFFAFWLEHVVVSSRIEVHTAEGAGSYACATSFESVERAMERLPEPPAREAAEIPARRCSQRRADHR
jgi:hypothetical protein